MRVITTATTANVMMRITATIVPPMMAAVLSIGEDAGEYNQGMILAMTLLTL